MQRSIAIIVTAMYTLFFVQVAHADPTLQGTYVIDPAHSENVDAAIERSIADMSFVIRPVARSRLVKTNPRYQRIALSHTETAIAVRFDARKPIEMPADGHKIPWNREDGEKFDVSAQWSGAQLVMRLTAEDGERTNTFVLEPDDTLKLHVQITSARLPKPVTYVLAYRRAAS
jgi:hypothetical protein